MVGPKSVAELRMLRGELLGGEQLGAVEFLELASERRTASLPAGLGV
jgi:hypothetical protein